MLTRPFIRSAYNYDRNEASLASSLSEFEPTRTQQQFKDDSNPNVIVQRFMKTRDPSLLTGGRTPQYGDFTGITSYHEALNAVINANDAFARLPSKIRNRFENDPAQLLDFLADEKNRDEAIELGLIEKPDASSSALGTPPDTVKAVGDPKAATSKKSIIKAVKTAIQGDDPNQDPGE